MTKIAEKSQILKKPPTAEEAELGDVMIDCHRRGWFFEAFLLDERVVYCVNNASYQPTPRKAWEEAVRKAGR